MSKQLTEEYTALKVLVAPETMKCFLDSLKQTRYTIAKRILEPVWQLDEWCKEPTYIEKWKLEILGSLGKYNWAFFLLEPDNLPKRKEKS